MSCCSATSGLYTRSTQAHTSASTCADRRTGTGSAHWLSCQMRMRLLEMLVRVPRAMDAAADLAISTRGFWAASWTHCESNLISAKPLLRYSARAAHHRTGHDGSDGQSLCTCSEHVRALLPWRHGALEHCVAGSVCKQPGWADMIGCLALLHQRAHQWRCSGTHAAGPSSGATCPPSALRSPTGQTRRHAASTPVGHAGAQQAQRVHSMQHAARSVQPARSAIESNRSCNEGLVHVGL